MVLDRFGVRTISETPQPPPPGLSGIGLSGAYSLKDNAHPIPQLTQRTLEIPRCPEKRTRDDGIDLHDSMIRRDLKQVMPDGHMIAMIMDGCSMN